MSTQQDSSKKRLHSSVNDDDAGVATSAAAAITAEQASDNAASSPLDHRQQQQQQHEHDIDDQQNQKRQKTAHSDFEEEVFDRGFDDDEEDDESGRRSSRRRSTMDDQQQQQQQQQTNNNNNVTIAPSSNTASILPQSSSSNATGAVGGGDALLDRDHDYDQQQQQQRQPGKVLFFRNLPDNCHEREIVDACKDYGVEEVVVLSVSHQAFVQFESTEKASRFLDAHQPDGTVLIRDRKVRMEFSNKRQVSNMKQREPTNNILLATVTQAIYPITTDVLHKVFSRYGHVEKIVIFNTRDRFRTDYVQGAIQYPSVENAIKAKEELDGQNIYANCCLLRVKFSTMKELKVTQNDDKTRDFTNPSLPTVAPQQQQPQQPPMFDHHHHPHHMGGSSAAAAMYGSAGGAPYGGHGGMPPHHGAGGYGGTAAGGWPPMQPADAYGAYPGMPGAPRGGFPSMDARSSHGGGMGGPPGPATVVFVQGISPDVRCDDLAIILGVYGDVKCVKILGPNKPDKALVEFMNQQGADAALEFLHAGCPLFGSVIHVSRSKHASINPSGNDDPKYFKTYMGSTLHRYRNMHGKHMCEPNTTLHVSNIDPTIADDRLRQQFSQFGVVEDLRDLGESSGRSNEPPKKMAIVRMDTLDNAVRALVESHDKSMGNYRIKVTFSSQGARGGRRRP